MKILLSLLLLTSINLTYAAQFCNSNTINDILDSRYINNNDGTITDKTTKLMWKQCSEGQIWVDGSPYDSCNGVADTINWRLALKSADDSTFASNQDWQLPNIKQLQSIASYHCYSPSINQNYFPNTPDFLSRFWSSTPNVLNASHALAVFFKSVSVHKRNRSDNHYVRLVRPMP